MDVRGFHKKSPAGRELLETIGSTFLTGYGYAAEARSADEVVPRLATTPVRFRGFGYEGAAMGFAVRDGLPLGGGGHFARFLAGPGRNHEYMAYIGVGWAMARLPKFRWPKDDFDPLLRWLVLDGYGFHQAYFKTQRYVHEHYQDPGFRWPEEGPAWYSARAVDQGIGRALWFVGGTDVDVVTRLVEQFPENRHPDLYGGVGLAATYAGGAEEEELLLLRKRAGAHRSQLAQGSAFAAEARNRAGLLVPHVHQATRILCGTSSAEQAAEVTIRLRPTQIVPGELPAYEVWRQQIADEFESPGR